MSAEDDASAQAIDIRSLAQAASRLSKAMRDASARRLREAEARSEADLSRGADLRLRLALATKFPLAWPWLARIRRDAAAHETASASRALALSASRCALDSSTAQSERAKQGHDAIERAIGMLPRLGPPPPATATELAAIARDARALLAAVPNRTGKAGDWPARARVVLGRFAEAVRGWSAHASTTAKAPEPPRPSAPIPAAAPIALPVAAPAPDMQSTSRGRIYLPVPKTLYGVVEKAGAHRAPDEPGWPSPWFIRNGMQVAPFRNLLPLGARKDGAGLTFPPIPPRAWGQNLWGLFDKDSWGHVRRQAYASSGHRCMICGGRSSGFIAKNAYPEHESGYPIECHEVWDWHVHPRHDDIGIQVLKQLLVVCRDCHPMFHEAFHVGRARQSGGPELAAEIAVAIRKRRMIMNRVDQAGLATALAQEGEHQRRIAGVENWVVDLRHLAAQTYMTHRVMTLQDENRSRTPPSRVAGIAFETQDGRRFPAVTPAEACRAIAPSREAGPAPPSR